MVCGPSWLSSVSAICPSCAWPVVRPSLIGSPCAIDDRVDFGRVPASGATQAMICVSAPLFCRRSLLVGTNRSAVDHLDVAVVCGGDGVHHPIPHTHAFRHRTKRL